MSSNMPFGFTPGDNDPEKAGGFDVNQLGAMLQQLGAMMQSSGGESDGPVNWDMVMNTARTQMVSDGDPSVTDGERSATETAVDLAEVWLDASTQFPAAGGRPAAWSRSEWLEATKPAWQRIIDPVAAKVQDTMVSIIPAEGAGPESLPAGLPPELASMLGPLMGMAKQMSAGMFSAQVAQALAALSAEVVSAGDVGVPLTSDGRPALLPANARTFGDGLDVPTRDTMLYLALREAAHQRLFAHVPWLRARLESAVEEYARGINVDMDRITSATQDLDISNPDKLQEVLSSGILVPEDTAEQRAALERLETLLALVEGWVDAVVVQAAGDRLPTLSRLQEALRRRRAAGGPAEKTFATLVGLELRPRRLRESAALWAALTEARGQDGRDAVWAHPDLLPTSDDLEMPEAFVMSSNPDQASSFEVELAAMASGAGPLAEAAADDAEADDDAAQRAEEADELDVVREAEQIEEEAAEEQAEDDAEVLEEAEEIVDAEAEDIAGETKRDGDDPEGKPGPSRS